MSRHPGITKLIEYRQYDGPLICEEGVGLTEEDKAIADRAINSDEFKQAMAKLGVDMKNIVRASQSEDKKNI